jgi:2-octaprenyl-6-methoxyphenol hydroxylase
MKVCILGGGLTSLSLAKTLVNMGISVDVFYDKKIKKQNNSRTIGLTKSNIEFFDKNILKLKKILWDIKK